LVSGVHLALSGVATAVDAEYLSGDVTGFPEMKKAQAAAMSSGRPTRRTGVRLMWSSTVPPSRWRLSALRNIGVSTNPGGTALTVIPAGPYSSAKAFVRPFTADFAAT